MPDREITPVEERFGTPPKARLSTDFEAGTIISGQYCVEMKLGDGGMGTVYRCRDLVLGRTVALKFLHPHLVLTSKWLMRFQQEAKAIGRLEHPNIIKINHFETDEDCPFIVMDYIKGESLSEIISKEGALDTQRSLKILTQVADALAHAHKHNVIHRDLKPSNIIILQGTGDVVKILDFGIAKIEETQSAPNLTQTGEIFGSPAYMSPEQCIGKNIDARSDQYSLGCVLYECLTGSPPFVSTSAMEVMMHHISDAPQSLKQVSLGRDFSKDLEKVVGKLLAKDPNERFESMTAACDAKAKTANSVRGIAIGFGTCAVLVATAWMIYQATNMTPHPPLTKSEVSQPIPSITAPAPAPPVTVAAMADREFGAELVDFQRRYRGSYRESEKFGPTKNIAIDNEAMKSITAVFPELLMLDLQDCTHITAAGIKELAKLPLRQFYFANSDPSDETLEEIAKIKTLKVVEVPGSISYTDHGVKALITLPLLEVLNIGNNVHLTELSLTYSAQSKTLHSIDLTMLPFKNLGILAKTKLKKINAYGTLIDDANVAKLATMPTLRHLCLSSTNITNASVPALCSMKNLQTLQVKGCHKLTDAGLLKLQNTFGPRLVEWR
jgi:serine/threonine protein kinase